MTDFANPSFCLEHTLSVGGRLPLDVLQAGTVMARPRGKGRHIERIAPHFVLLFVRKGVLSMREEEQTFEVQAGQSLLLWPHRRHWGTQDYSEDLQFFWLHFTIREGQEGQEGQMPFLVPQHAQLTRPDLVTELFRHYLDDQDTGNLHPLAATLYAWLILLEIANTRPPTDLSAATVLAGRAYTFVQTHFHENIMASDVALAVGYNAQYLSRVYQQTYRHSLSGAIRRARISHAKILLLHTDHNVGEIARQSGFEDATYFQRVFKQLEGMTPLRFRRLHARMQINN